MENLELLKTSRNQLLGLHKSLIDFERNTLERTNGEMTSGQFLNVLIEDSSFAWLRLFSTLIVDIDESLAQKDGVADTLVSAYLDRMRGLVNMEGLDEDVSAKYRNVVQNDAQTAVKQAQLKALLSK